MAGGARVAWGGACRGRRCPGAPGSGGRHRRQLERAGAEKVEPPHPRQGSGCFRTADPEENSWGGGLVPGTSGPITRARACAKIPIKSHSEVGKHTRDLPARRRHSPLFPEGLREDAPQRLHSGNAGIGCPGGMRVSDLCTAQPVVRD